MERQKRTGKPRRKKTVLGEKERRSLIQMAVSLLLFLVMFAGQEAFPEKAVIWREELRGILRKDTDFQQVFYYLGASVAEEASVLETLDTVWIEVFGSGNLPMEEPDRTAAMTLRMELQQGPEPLIIKPARPVRPVEPEPLTPVQAAVKEDLGLTESLTPVFGVLTSGYGMRVHPIYGETLMHEGIDIAAEQGTSILAFADGKVNYIGESDAYGMYLQLQHDNGVTTFYAHCSELCVQKGERVSQGDVVAKVGSTGVSTGPHLHFEVKKNGTFLDPKPYVEYLLE